MQTESSDGPVKGPSSAASSLTFSIAKIMEPDPRPRQSPLDSAFKKYVPVIHQQSLLQHYPVLYYHPGYYLRAGAGIPLGAATDKSASSELAVEPADKESPDTKGRHKTFTCTDCGKVRLVPPFTVHHISFIALILKIYRGHSILFHENELITRRTGNLTLVP